MSFAWSSPFVVPIQVFGPDPSFRSQPEGSHRLCLFFAERVVDNRFSFPGVFAFAFTMPYIHPTDANSQEAISMDMQHGIDNRWRWEWLELLPKPRKSKKSKGKGTPSQADKEMDPRLLVPLGTWLKKVDKPGMCHCIVCNKAINYGKNGITAIQSHASCGAHMNAFLTRQSCPSITAGSEGLPLGVTSMAERKAEIKAVALAFLAEHNLPFSIAPDLLDLAKRLAEDKAALKRVAMSRTCAAYTSTHGLGNAMKEAMDKKLRVTPFSLNLDEATNNNDDKIVNIMVQFFDEDKGQVVVQHFGSVCVNIAKAQNIFDSLIQMLADRDIPVQHIVSCLMDNCPTMRGCRGGVETLLRKKQPTLLNIAGDTVHILSNAAKTLFKDFKDECEKVCELIYYDSDMSGKSKEILAELQDLLNMTCSAKNARGYLTVQRPCQSRFLNMLPVTERLVQLKDALLVYYFSFLTKEEQEKHKATMKEIFERRGVGEQERQRIGQLQKSQGKVKPSAEGQTRKDIILTALFQEQDKFFTTVDLYRGILPVLNGFVKKFQTEKPLCHMLHGDMACVIRNFLALFLKREAIKEGRAQLLLDTDLDNKANLLPLQSLSVGKFAYLSIRRRNTQKYWVTDLLKKLQKGYLAAAKVLIQQLPIDNATIRNLSCLHPAAYKENALRKNFEQLAEKLSNVVPEDQLGELDQECRRYIIDTEIAELAANFEASDTRMDSDYWAHVFKLQEIGEGGLRYPVLSKLIKAAITVFCGPIVEASFNLMDDIIRPDRSSIEVEQYEGTAIIKSTLRAEKKKSTTLQVTQAMKRSIIEAKSSYNAFLVRKKERKEAAKQRRLELAAAKKSSRRAIRGGPAERTNTRNVSLDSRDPGHMYSNPVPVCSTSAPVPPHPTSSSSSPSLPAANKSTGNRKRKASADIRGFFKKLK